MLEQGGSLTGVAAAREGVAVLRAYAWLVVALTIVGLAVGFLTATSNDESKYRVWVTAQALGANGAVTGLGISTPDGPQAADFLGEGILNRIEAETGDSYDYLIEHLTLTQPPNGGPNPPIELIAGGDSDSAARALLATWMTSIHQARRHYVYGLLTKGEDGLRKSLTRAIKLNEPVTQRAIVDLLARMQALRTTLTVDYAIERKPKVFEENTASKARQAVVSGVVGLIAGLVLALLISLLGGRLRTVEGIEAALDAELLVDLRSPSGVPSEEHARKRLRSLGDGQLPSLLLLVPCGKLAPDEAATRLSKALGEGTEVRASEPLGGAGALDELERADACAIVASPGAVRRAEAAALRAELDGTGVAPAGLVVI